MSRCAEPLRRGRSLPRSEEQTRPTFSPGGPYAHPNPTERSSPMSPTPPESTCSPSVLDALAPDDLGTRLYGSSSDLLAVIDGVEIERWTVDPTATTIVFLRTNGSGNSAETLYGQ